MSRTNYERARMGMMEEKTLLLLVADRDALPQPPVSLVGRLGITLAALRARIERGRFLLAWALGASILAGVLLIERNSAERPAPAAPAERPLPPAPAAPIDLAPPLPPALAGAPPPLVGIVGRLPDDAVALVRKPDGRTRTLQVGALFDGWTLASLDSGEAVFERRGQQVTVALPPPDQ